MPTARIIINNQPHTVKWDQETNRACLIRQEDGEVIDHATVKNLSEFIQYIDSIIKKPETNEKDN